MDWENYRKLLGLGFNDDQRTLKCVNIILNEMEEYINYVYYHSCGNFIVSPADYKSFCNTLGIRIKKCDINEEIDHVMYEIKHRKGDLRIFIESIIALVNTVTKKSLLNSNKLIEIVENAFNESGIRFEVISDNDKYFLISGGARELDDALVVENLLWLKDYKMTHKTFTQTLLQYSNKENPRDVADNLRKTLEQFLQEFFNNEKTLSNNTAEVGKFFDEKQVHHELKNIFTSLIFIARHNENKSIFLQTL